MSSTEVNRSFDRAVFRRGGNRLNWGLGGSFRKSLQAPDDLIEALGSYDVQLIVPTGLKTSNSKMSTPIRLGIPSGLDLSSVQQPDEYQVFIKPVFRQSIVQVVENYFRPVYVELYEVHTFTPG